DLGSNPDLLKVRLAWTTNIGRVDFPLEPRLIEQGLLLVNSVGSVVTLNTSNGVQSAQVSLGDKISAGLGASAETTAVVTRNNELITTSRGREVWRQ
ncbi:MAG: outer membrane protein assembly factor BamB, partial [Burkholderiaceae bacterium]|nr:outer membrane protein assembly factor BamB [Burkholderiaceae bacterium]